MGTAVTGVYAPPEWGEHNLCRGISLLQWESRLALSTRRWPQAPGEGCGGLSFEQHWSDYRLISRSSVKPRKTRTKLNLGRHSAALRAAKLMCDEISPISARRCSRNSFKVPQFPSLNIQYTLKLHSSLPTSFVMAALESISFVPF